MVSAERYSYESYFGVSEKDYLVITEFQILFASYKWGKFTFLSIYIGEKTGL